MLRALPLLFALVACGEKAPPSNAGSATTESAPSKVSGAPEDSASQSFARALVGMTVKDFSASGASGATFKYATLKFGADGTFAAEGYVEIDDERMECQESGGWKMDPADSATVASLSWTIDKTNCPGRDAGTEVRAKVDLSDTSNPQFSFR